MKYYIVTSLVSLGVGAAVALKLRPPVVKTEIRTEVKTNTVVKTQRVKHPDGRVETNIIRETNKQQTSQKTRVAPKANKGNYIVSLYSQRNLWDTKHEAFGVAVQKKVFTHVYLFGSADSKGNYALGLGLEF